MSGKVTRVVKTDGSSLEFKYDPMGHRCEKVFTDVEGKVKRTLYVRDAQGNMLSVYGYKAVENETLVGGNTENAWLAYLYARSLEVKKNPTDASLYLRDSLLGRIGGVWNMANGTALFNAIYAQNWLEVVNLVAGVNDPDRGNNQSGLYGRRELGAMMEEFIYMRGWIASVPETLLTQRRTVERTLVQTEAHLYGSSRLGVDKVNRLLLKQSVTEVYVPFSKRWVFLRVEGAPTVQPDDDSLYLCIRGKKRYEFSNHLGNVMTTLTDRRVWVSDRWVADAVSGQDYDPFGMVRPNRSVSEDGYRFGFNGKEKDSEFGEVVYDYGFRIYDGRICRFLSVDPLTRSFPWWTPFQFAGNTPIMAIDLDGKELEIATYFYDKNGQKVNGTPPNAAQIQKLIDTADPAIQQYLKDNDIKVPVTSFVSRFKIKPPKQKRDGSNNVVSTDPDYDVDNIGQASLIPRLTETQNTYRGYEIEKFLKDNNLEKTDENETKARQWLVSVDNPNHKEYWEKWNDETIIKKTTLSWDAEIKLDLGALKTLTEHKLNTGQSPPLSSTALLRHESIHIIFMKAFAFHIDIPNQKLENSPTYNPNDDEKNALKLENTPITDVDKQIIQPNTPKKE